ENQVSFFGTAKAARIAVRVGDSADRRTDCGSGATIRHRTPLQTDQNGAVGITGSMKRLDAAILPSFSGLSGLRTPFSLTLICRVGNIRMPLWASIPYSNVQFCKRRTVQRIELEEGDIRPPHEVLRNKIFSGSKRI